MSAIFILSSGRCGTQWLAKQLHNVLVNHYWVTHEPLHFDYAPNKNSPSKPLDYNRNKIQAHATQIQNHLSRGGHYIECGFPCWRHLDWYREILQTDVKVIHLHRHPVDTARSWLKQNAFVMPLLPHLPEKSLFHPLAPEANLPDYVNRWEQMSPFERNLYYWAEVQLQAENYNRSWDSKNWLEIRFDQLFEVETFNRLKNFLDFPLNSDNVNFSREDAFPGIEQALFDTTLINRHSAIQEMSQRLGYYL